jgi:hypothetical protein
MTTLKLIGTYRVPVSEEELRFITEEVTGNSERTQEEVGGLALLEIEVRGASMDFDVGLLRQEGSDQVAYEERYFTVDGSQSLSLDKPAQSDFRVCFFLHHFDASKNVRSPYGDVTPTRLTDMPDRLSEVCVYEHPG